jgi:clan AA aspartic protease
MIAGTVSARLAVSISLRIFGPSGQAHDVTAAIDTGYNGGLTLPLAIVMALNLPQLAAKEVTLGDNSRWVMSFFDAVVLWDGRMRRTRVLCADVSPLVGTALLRGHHLGIDFVDGGSASIVAIP